jgi:ubiquinone/menaquinone biosynthesis C-methylase UbiE
MSFDLLAPHYRWMEFVLAGGKLQRCRTAFFDKIGPAQNVLILGEGNGRFLVELRPKLPSATFTILDASPKMLEQARKRVLRAGLDPAGIRFLHQDILDWEPEPASADLIVTHFFLDCFSEAQLDTIISRVARAAAPQAVWLLADFAVPASGFPRLRARAIHALMYAFFRLATRLPARALSSPAHFLERKGFVLQEQMTYEWGLLHSDFWRRASNPADARS